MVGGWGSSAWCAGKGWGGQQVKGTWSKRVQGWGNGGVNVRWEGQSPPQRPCVPLLRVRSAGASPSSLKGGKEECLTQGDAVKSQVGMGTWHVWKQVLPGAEWCVHVRKSVGVGGGMCWS